jgi:hypothetical protein
MSRRLHLIAADGTAKERRIDDPDVLSHFAATGCAHRFNGFRIRVLK